jgi:hypothetical protein
MKIDNAIDKLNAAYKRLEEPQGRIARKNARDAFLYALKALRKGLDDEYPLERKKVTRRRKPNPRRAVNGKIQITTNQHRRLLASGVSPGAFVERGKGASATVWAPRWMKRAYEAGIDHKHIKEAVRSQPKRRRMMAIVRLGKTKSP